MKGAPTRAIQELAGNQDLVTTQRYIQLSPAALDGAIRLGHARIRETRGNQRGTGRRRTNEVVWLETVKWWTRTASVGTISRTG